MARKKKAFGKDKNFKRGGGNNGNWDDRDQGYAPIKRENPFLEKYYQGLGIVPEGEWDEFYATLKKTLPVSFRITGYKKQSAELLNMFKTRLFGTFAHAMFEGEPVKPPKNLPWYPNEMGWQLDLTRKIIRSNEDFSRLHDFLVAATECGAISRQEAVSMIPPIVLGVKSHHKVLDMCAAPGSKTAQLIEDLHGTAPPGTIPTGYVIANDSDNKRCYMMVHQVKRLASPCVTIVNHDATVFPKIRSNLDNNNAQYELFDRVLCDVPCSGDGTMRKNFDVWTKWHPLQGANLHGLQSKILRRGCQLLNVGGRLVYSTCSLNPVEDEAVIAEMLRQSEGAMELIDIKNMLPDLKFVEGLSTWRVMSRSGEWMSSSEDVPANLKTQYKMTIFPPTKEEAEKFHLEKCIRILPHQQDTGGFFVAGLQKVRHLPGSREANQAAAESQAEKEGKQDSADAKQDSADAKQDSAVAKREHTDERTDDGPPAKKFKLWGNREDPFLFMDDKNPAWPSIREFFGLGEACPREQIMYRSEKGQRNLYFVSAGIKHVAECNEGKVKFINMGVKAFSRSPSPLVPDCDFRINQECLGTFLLFVTKRTVNVTKSDAIIMLSEENPYSSKLSDKLQEQFKEISVGSTIFIYNPSEEDTSPNCEIVFCGWRGKMSVRFFGSRCDRSHYLWLFGEDLKEINKRVEAQKKEREEAKKLKGDSEAAELNEEEDSSLPKDEALDKELKEEDEEMLPKDEDTCVAPKEEVKDEVSAPKEEVKDEVSVP